MKKYFYTFSLTLLLMIASIAYLKRADKDQFLIRSLTISLGEQAPDTTKSKYNFRQTYVDILKCNSTYSEYFVEEGTATIEEKYTKAAPQETHSIRMTRAVLVYFPIDQINNFKNEFKWLYRSWIEMQKHESPKWRTDLVVFINKSPVFEKKEFFLNGLNCTFANRRRLR